jgi:GTP-binding protein EngB required for normal cell division
MYKALRVPGASLLTQTFKKSFENIIFHLVAIGNTNVGKSTLLNDIIGHRLLNVSE